MPVLTNADVRSAPLRAIVASRIRSGRGSLLGPDTHRRRRWWRLTLECGHLVDRDVRYRPTGLWYRVDQRDEADALPPPRRARCEHCRG